MFLPDTLYLSSTLSYYREKNDGDGVRFRMDSGTREQEKLDIFATGQRHMVCDMMLLFMTAFCLLHMMKCLVIFGSFPGTDFSEDVLMHLNK